MQMVKHASAKIRGLALGLYRLTWNYLVYLEKWLLKWRESICLCGLPWV